MDNANNNKLASANLHFEKDKQLAPYLLICEGVDFLGVEHRSNIVFFKFSPNEKVQIAIKQFYDQEAVPVQPKVLLDAVERFKTEIYRAKV